MRYLLKSKIHRVIVTELKIDYEGSVSIDNALMVAADIVPYEQVHVLNVSNGARFITYAMPAEAATGIICVNGAAARLVGVGDKLILLTYHSVTEEDSSYLPQIVHVDENNRIEY